MAEVKEAAVAIMLTFFFCVGDAFACHQYLFSAFSHYRSAVIVEQSMDKEVQLVLDSWDNIDLPKDRAAGLLLRMSSFVIQSNHFLISSGHNCPH